MDYLELTARITSPIPDKGQVMVSYYELYSNAHISKIQKVNVDLSHPLVIVEEMPFIPPILEGGFVYQISGEVHSA